VITHAFFKALLFLGAGSVIRGVAQQHRESETRTGPHPRNGHSNEFDPSDVTNMGGLARHMPRTFRTFLVGGLALAGFPLVTAGFWSQNGILAQSYESSPAIFWGLAVAVGLTAFYTMRLICLIFCGEPRIQAADGCYSPASVLESTPKIIAPLIILALFSAGLGWAGIPEQLPIIGGSIPDWFHHFVSSTIETVPTLGRGFVWQPMALGAAFSLGGLALGWLVYGWRPMQAGEIDRLETAMRQAWLGWLYACLRERFYLDQICQATIVRGSALLADLADAFDQRVLGRLANLAGHAGRSLSRISAWLDTHIVDAAANVVGHAGKGTSRVCDAFDRQVVDRMVGLTSLCLQAVSGLSATIDVKLVDGAAEGVSRAIRASGRFIRPIQSGNIQDYLLRATLMLLTLIAVFLLILFLRI
jgi:NADH-quinone oxidoreductase subunit L